MTSFLNGPLAKTCLHSVVCASDEDICSHDEEKGGEEEDDNKNATSCMVGRSTHVAKCSRNDP